MVTRSSPVDNIEALAQAYWTMTGRSLANTAKTLTKPAQAGKRHYLTSYLVWIDDAASAQDVTIEIRDGALTIWEDTIGNAALRGTRVGMNWGNPGIELSSGSDLSIVVGAGGASVVTVVNMTGYTL